MSDAKLDFIDDRFIQQKIKTQKVLCQKQLQETGEITIPAPAGLVLDPSTGKLNSNVTLQLDGTPQLRTVTVLPGKIIEQGIVPVDLLVNNIIIEKCIEIPFKGIIVCADAQPGDTVQKHDVQIVGFSVSPIQICDGKTQVLHLILTVLLEMCLIVTSERIVNVNIAEQFC